MHRRDISMGLLGAATAATFVAAESRAQTCTAPCYAQIPQEQAAGVTPTNTSYLPGDVRRYGATMLGTMDDSAAWNRLGSVMAQGVNGYAPPLPTLITNQVTITIPGLPLSFSSGPLAKYGPIQSGPAISLFGYGCTILTEGPIDALRVTNNNNLGSLSLYGLTHNNVDGMATNGFNAIGCNHTNFIDCNIVVPTAAKSPSTTYSGVVFEPTSDGNGFWNSVVRLRTRQNSGNPPYYAPFGVRLQGQCNATIIRDCSFSSVNYGVGIQNQPSGADYLTTLANAVVIDGCAFEGCVAGVLVNGNGVTSQGGLAGLRITNNRMEALTQAFLILDYLAVNSSWPTYMAGNFDLLSAGVPYILQNNTSGLQVTVNTPALTTL
jgi:hypothetical protein